LGSSTTSHVKEQETAAGEPGAAAGPICVVVVEEAADGERAVRVVARVKPDVVLMDLRLPQASGVEATRRILERLPGTHVLVLTISDAERDVTDAILAGARGYLLKESTLEEIMAGIRSAAVGQSTLSPRIAARVLDRLRALEQSGRVREGEADLTERELEILGLMAVGKDNAEIGDKLVIITQTVKNHVSSILAKLRLENRVQAAVHAVRRGIV